MKKADYTVYSRKTTLPVTFGSLEECARGLGMKYHTFAAMASKRHSGKGTGKYLIIKEGVDHLEDEVSA